MKRWIGICLMLLMLVGCARPSVDAPIAEPSGLYPDSIDPLYTMSAAEYFSKERDPHALNRVYEGKIVIEGAQLLWKKEGETVCLAQLPTQNWQRVVDRTQVGVVLISDTGAWIVDREGGLRSLIYAPSDEKFSFMLCQPYFYAAIGAKLYRGHLLQDELELLCMLDGDTAPQITGLNRRNNIDIELRVRHANGDWEMQMYCEANGKRYALTEVKVDHIWRYDEQDYLTARNADLKNRGTDLTAFCLPVEWDRTPLTFTVSDAPSWENPYQTDEAAFMAVEIAQNYEWRKYQAPYIEVDPTGEKHDCTDGKNHLVWCNPLVVPQYTRCLGDLGEGNWKSVSVTTQVGVLVYCEDDRTLWLYETDRQRLHPIATLPAGMGEIGGYVSEPLYYIVGDRSVYRGSLISGRLTKLYELPMSVPGKISHFMIWTNDALQLTVYDGTREDYGWILSNHTGRAYHVQATFNGGWITADWDSFHARRRADLDKMGMTEEFFKTYERNWSDP